MKKKHDVCCNRQVKNVLDYEINRDINFIQGVLRFCTKNGFPQLCQCGGEATAQKRNPISDSLSAQSNETLSCNK